MQQIDLSLVFPRHTEGALAGEVGQKNIPPPVGLLTIAAYIRERCPDVRVEVLDGNRVSDRWMRERLDAPIVGFSVWFSNYQQALDLARGVKARNPFSRVIFGGPHATALGCLILDNHRFVDAVVVGDGEEAMLGIVKGDIEARGVISRPVAMDQVSVFDLEPLATPYRWIGQGSSAQAFPLSCIRGCFRKVRCEYCSIPTTTVRTLPVERAWEQIRVLKERYDIDFFFESGDTFLPGYARALLKSSSKQSVRFRIYGYPGMLRRDVADLYAELGVSDLFLGVESVLIWKGGFNRSYGRRYGYEDLLAEIELAGSVGIEVMPSFIFGLPGETRASLAENKTLVRRILALPNVRDFHLNPPIPLPGTQYFKSCVNNPAITSRYRRRTGHELASCDVIDYLSLCRDFVDATTNVGSEDVFAAVDELLAEHPSHVSHWYQQESTETRRTGIDTNNWMPEVG